MLIEREDKPGVIQTLLSILILSSLLFFTYHAKGEISIPAVIDRVANLKHFVEAGSVLDYRDPLPVFFVLLFKKFSSGSYFNVYYIAVSFVYSILLHSILLALYQKKWKLYHFMIVYFTAFLPFNLYSPLVFYQEYLCALSVSFLIYFFALENLLDLFYIFLFTVIALFADLGLFPFFYLVFVFTVTFQKIREKKSQTTVFFKKKNIPFRILVGYSGFMIFILLIFILTDFFGETTLLTLLHRLGEFSLGILPIILAIFLLRMLLVLESGAPELIASMVLLLATLGVGYYSYIQPKGENLESVRRIESEFLNLRKAAKIPPDVQIFARSGWKNSLYYKEGISIVSDIAVNMKPGDYYLLEDLPANARGYLDKKNIPPANPIPYYFLNANTLFLSKSLADKVLSESELSELGKSIKALQSRLVSPELNPHQKWCRLTGKIFGI